MATSDPNAEPRPTGPELILGLVGALGADLEGLYSRLREELEAVDYQVSFIRLSEILGEIEGWTDLPTPLPTSPFDQRIRAHQLAGNQLRTRTGSGETLAVLGVGKIQTLRRAITQDREKPAPRTAYIIRSLKRQDEVEALRRIYGPYFFLLAAYSPRDSRESRLSSQIAQSHHSTRPDEFRSNAQDLISHDDHEPDRFGQGVRDAFPLADAFFSTELTENLRDEVSRFVAILFGDPFQTPTRDEFGMFQARAAALRSSDLSRQVGAAIATKDGDVMAVGTNEVPKAGGGLYWPGDNGDARDFQIGRNESFEMRKTTLEEVLSILHKEGICDLTRFNPSSIETASNALLPLMKDTQLMSIGEFGRTVHAEMAALLDALRRGVSTLGATLYTTTFPCHNCTRHIIAAGIARVVYIEPFPKSHAQALHRDAIVVDNSSWVEGRVNFQPFVGISPARYFHLFEATPRKAPDGVPATWKRRHALPRFSEEWTAPTYPTVEAARLLGAQARMEDAGLRFAEPE